MENKQDLYSPAEEGQTPNNTELIYLRKQILVLNERLKEAEKYKSSFLSNMRNDIINPFTSILGLSANLLNGGLNSRERLHKTISLIFQETFALDFHLKSIFLAAEIEIGECYPGPTIMRPESVIAHALAALDHLLSRRKVRLAVYQSFEDDVCCDADKLQMIFTGLLYNILLKCHDGDGISIKAYTKDEVLYAEIYNTSVMGEKRSLFDLAQFKELCMFNENMDGLHLSVAKSLTETLNGQLEAGTYMGEFAAFRFSIPVAANVAGNDVFEEQGIIFK